MNPVIKKSNVDTIEVREDFNLGSAIIMIFLVLSFLGASFYVLISSYS